MKKKIVTIIFISIFLLGTISFLLLHKNSKITFMKDGVLFAVKVDGVSQASFPNNADIYHVDLTCTNARCLWKRIKNQNDNNYSFKLLIDNISGNVECDMDFISVDTTDPDNEYFLNNIVKENATDYTSDSTGYRYIGADPNNYIWFNNEMWRIIGLIPTVTEYDEVNNEVITTNNLVKIIRKDHVGSLVYDAKASGPTSQWGNNTLYALLNNYYWGKLDGTVTNSSMPQYCFTYRVTTKGKCNYTNIGISSSPNDYYGRMVEEVYWNTGTSAVNLSAVQTFRNEQATNQIGRIGLMNASDYLYCGTVSQENWMYIHNYDWTLTPLNATSPQRIYTNFTIQNAGQSASDGNYSFRPVVYLSPSVYVVAGDGSESNPYQINMISNNA